jgi:hypothetical protein
MEYIKEEDTRAEADTLDIEKSQKERKREEREERKWYPFRYQRTSDKIKYGFLTIASLVILVLTIMTFTIYYKYVRVKTLNTCDLFWISCNILT